MNKIGMCTACGDQHHSSKTVMFNGMELCRHCAEMMGYDGEEDEDES